MKQISKFLALTLRHKPELGSLTLDEHGWAEVDDVIQAVAKRYGSFDLSRLEELVRTNDKRRFTFDESGSRIRASQGHSVPVELGLEQAEPPDFLYHGTASCLLEQILREGLNKGRRHHVHLSPDFETAEKVGNRRGGETAVLEVRSGAMSRYSFFLSANGVWLTDHVPPEYLSPISIPRR